MIGRWLQRAPHVLILDEPTRGVDIGARVEIHRLIRRLADEGMAVLVISSEPDELPDLCDRVLVMQNGTIMEEGRTSEILPGSEHPYTRQLIAALPSLSPARTPLPVGYGGRA